MRIALKSILLNSGSSNESCACKKRFAVPYGQHHFAARPAFAATFHTGTGVDQIEPRPVRSDGGPRRFLQEDPSLTDEPIETAGQLLKKLADADNKVATARGVLKQAQQDYEAV